MRKRVLTRIIAAISLAVWALISGLVWWELGIRAKVALALPLVYLVAVSVRGSWSLSKGGSQGDFFVVLRRISGRHLKYHMMYPLAIGGLLEFAFIFWGQPAWSLHAVLEALREFFRLQHIVPVLGVVLTYLVLLYRFITTSTVIPYNTENLAKVRGHLRDATGYFALSPIRLKDWFKPNSVRYFSMLLSKKRDAEQKNGTFDYQRVFVFARDRDYNDAITQVLDRPYSWALSRFHGDFSIPLAYVKQRELGRVLDRLDQNALPELLGPTMWPEWMIKYFKLHLRKPWIFHLDFALIYNPKGNVVIVAPVGKDDAAIIEDKKIVGIYEQLINELQKATHDNEGNVRDDHDFVGLISDR
jgi:hypothetical protein